HGGGGGGAQTGGSTRPGATRDPRRGRRARSALDLLVGPRPGAGRDRGAVDRTGRRPGSRRRIGLVARRGDGGVGPPLRQRRGGARHGVHGGQLRRGQERRRGRLEGPARPARGRMSAAADPILASVLQRRVKAISEEMATVLMRSSRSPIFNEIGDLVTVVFDRSARTLAQTEYASIIANGAQPPLDYMLEYFGDDLHDGDVILHNDVYTRG